MKDTAHRKLNIRPMQEKDISGVGNIEKVSFASPWTSQLFHMEIKKKNFAYYYVLELEERVVGYAGYWKMHNEAHLVTFAVHPSYRKRGWGKILLDHILKDTRGKGIRRLTLEVRKSNIAAQHLYEGFGFKKVAIRSSYYHDTSEDAVVYWKIL